MGHHILAAHELRDVILTLIVVGSPLIAFFVQTAFRGKPYLRRRWRVVLIYYVLVAGHEIASRFLVVAFPLMILVACAPVLALFLLMSTTSADEKSADSGSSL